MLMFQHLLLTSSLFWVLLLTVTFIVLAVVLLLYSTTNTCDQVIMPSSEWLNQSSISNVQKFFTSHDYQVSSASKPVPTWQSQTDNGGPLNENGTAKGNYCNVNLVKKGSITSNNNSDDSFNRSEHAPRVVAVEMKDNSVKLSCKPPLIQEKNNLVSSWSASHQSTADIGSNGIKPDIPLRRISREQISKNGPSTKEHEGIIRTCPTISVSNSLAPTGEQNKQVYKQLFLPAVSTLSVSGFSSNLSTVIAVNSAESQGEMHAVANASLTTKKSVPEDEPRSSTVIVVNCDGSQQDGSLKSPLLASKMKDFSGKNVVWTDIKEECMQIEPLAGVKAAVNIPSGLENCNDIPPPIPPLPVALRTKFFNREGKIINTNEPKSSAGSVLSTVNGKASFPLNRLCLHPKIKLKNLHSSPPAFSNHKPSRIPKLCPTPTGLRSVDCLVSLYEDGIAAEQRRREIQKEGEQKRKISRSLKQSWEEVFKKYEALEKECDTMYCATSSSNCKLNCSSKSVGNLSDVTKNREENKQSYRSSSIFSTNKENNRQIFKKTEVGRLKSAPCSLLHLKDAVESENADVSSTVVSRTISDVNLCHKALTEYCWPKVVSCRVKTVWPTPSKSEKEINNNQVVSQKNGNEDVSVQCIGTSAVIGLGNAETGGIGVVRASTGRQVSSCRYRTELEVQFMQLFLVTDSYASKVQWSLHTQMRVHTHTPVLMFKNFAFTYSIHMFYIIISVTVY